MCYFCTCVTAVGVVFIVVFPLLSNCVFKIDYVKIVFCMPLVYVLAGAHVKRIPSLLWAPNVTSMGRGRGSNVNSLCFKSDFLHFFFY